MVINMAENKFFVITTVIFITVWGLFLFTIGGTVFGEIVLSLMAGWLAGQTWVTKIYPIVFNIFKENT